jgi:phage replication O-like protein O
VAKGDRKILKADIDDGYTTVANLLIEALAIAKMTGIQKGICLFLIRRTYGWGQKEDAITLNEFAQACDTSPSYVSKQLKELIKWGVIKRVRYEPGKTPVYTINTRVAQWCKGCIDVQGLHERIIQGLYNCARVPLHNRARVEQAQTLDTTGAEAPPKESIKESINKDLSSLTGGEGHSPPAASQGQENTPPNNQQLIAELVRKYRETGAKSQKGDYPFIGRLYNEFGYDRVLMGINALGYKLAVGFHPDDPLIYLGGIVRKEDKPDAKIRGDPYQNQKAGQADQYAKYNALFKTQRNSCRA